VTITQPWRKPAALLGAAIIATSGIIGAAPRQSAHAAPAIPQGGTVIAAESQIQGTLNPLLNQALATADVDSAVFDSMVYQGPDGNYLNDLATGYSHDAKGLHWKFFLNPKARWQDGVPLTADDVVYTDNLINNPKFGATFTTGFDHIKSVKAVGKYEVDYTLTSVFAPFFGDVGVGYILPKHILGSIAPEKIKNNKAYNQKPLASGPFKITEYAGGDHVTETANKNYFRGAPHLDKIIFRIVPNNNTAINQIQTGEISLLGATSSISARQFNLLKRFPTVKIYNTPGNNWAHLDLIQAGFFKDRTVRQALAYATPKQQIIDQVALGYGTIDDADQAPTNPYYNSAIKNSYPYNPAKAKSMLLADGFKVGAGGILQKGGKPLTIILAGDTNTSDTKLILQILKNAWAKVGINATFNLVDASILFGSHTGPLESDDRLSKSTTTAVNYTWFTGGDPDDTYFWGSNQIPGKGKAAGGNFPGYKNSEMDKLLQQGITTLDKQQRVNIYKKIQTLLVRDQPDLFLYWSRVLTAATPKLHGYQPQPNDFYLCWNAKDWYMQ
jgi:peptide/nickel transport system substrate-binding protein